MNGAPASVPSAPQLDWEDWSEALRGFGGATGLCVSAYDDAGVRRVGPYLGSRIATFLDEHGAWDAGGAAAAFESSLVRTVLQSRAAVDDSLDGTLKVVALPLPSSAGAGDARGVVVFGWILTAFSSSLECQRIAGRLGVDGGRLWAAARAESPVPATRLAVARQLLQTLIDSTARHAGALERVEELARMREVFLAGVSHELRTPLGALLSRIELLLRSPLDDKAAIRSSLAHMKRHVSEEVRLVEDLLDAARTRTGQLTVHREPLALAGIVDAAVAAVLPGAETKNVNVVLPGPDALAGCRVLADAHRLQQVFWNLLSNAVKFTPQGGRVEVSAHADGDSCCVAVSDTGRGIEAAALPFVFEPFVRQRDDNAHGMGLGLSIARQIVRLHDGAITVRSDGPDQGATFQVRLPRLREPPEAATAERQGP